MGSPRMNFIAGTVHGENGGKLTVETPAHSVIQTEAPAELTAGSKITIGARPEHVSLADNGIPARVHAVERLGDVSYVYVKVDGSDDPLVVRADPERDCAPGDQVHLAIMPSRVHVFGPNGKVVR